jgi:gamma-glutamyltranspeptidase / glutathione hydrolase
MRILFLTMLSAMLLAPNASAQRGGHTGGQTAGGDRLVGEPFASRSPVTARNGMAATSHPLASQIALDILKQGGSAVDAAIAANAALGLMEPVNSGIGGDLYAIVWDPGTRRLYGLNASGRSPAGLSLETLKKRLGERAAIPIYGALSVSVPGTVDGWFELHGRFGRLPMEQLLAPTIRYAREGFPLTQVIAHIWQDNADAFEANADAIEELDNFRATFLIDGKAPEEGEIFRNPDLAATYERIGREGRDAFYSGAIAETIDAYMRRIGGFLFREDLASHTSIWVDPVVANYRGYDVFQLPPNTQGVAALQMLKILEGYDLASMGVNSADYLHLQAEAKKLAFADRARYYSDPDFAEAPIDWLISEEYAEQRRRLIRMDRALREIDHGDPRLEAGDTVYLTTADSTGMMVSLIQSNYWEMGSGLVPDGLGFMLQDRGALFALDEHHPNVYAPGKRPFHTIIPGFVMKDGEPFMSFGVMGGAMQPQGHVQVLCNIIDFGMNVQEAGDAARYRHAGSSQPTGEMMTDGGVLLLESGIPEEVAAALRERGHQVRITTYDRGYGGYQAILRDPVSGVYYGASEMRKDGQAVGW